MPQTSDNGRLRFSDLENDIKFVIDYHIFVNMPKKRMITINSRGEGEYTNLKQKHRWRCILHCSFCFATISLSSYTCKIFTIPNLCCTRTKRLAEWITCSSSSSGICGHLRWQGPLHSEQCSSHKSLPQWTPPCSHDQISTVCLKRNINTAC